MISKFAIADVPILKSHEKKIRTLPGPPQQKDMSHQWIYTDSHQRIFRKISSPLHDAMSLPSRLVGDVSHHHSEDIVLERYKSTLDVPGYEEICTPQVISSLKSCRIYIYISLSLSIYLSIYLSILIDTNGDYEFHKRLGGERGELCRFCKENGSVGDKFR